MGMMNGMRKLLTHRSATPDIRPAEEPTAPTGRAEVEHRPSAGEGIPDAIDIDGLVEAVRVAKIARILFVGTPEANRKAGVLLARALAGSGTSTVLVDTGGEGRAAWDMGAIGRSEDMRTLAASPVTFADAIHRDQRSRAHVMTASLDSLVLEGSGAEAATTVMTALSQAYARSVVVFDEVPFRLLHALIDENTALVLPGDDDDALRSSDARRKLIDLELGDPVALMLPSLVERATRAA